MNRHVMLLLKVILKSCILYLQQHTIIHCSQVRFAACLIPIITYSDPMFLPKHIPHSHSISFCTEMCQDLEASSMRELSLSGKGRQHSTCNEYTLSFMTVIHIYGCYYPNQPPPTLNSCGWLNTQESIPVCTKL